MILLTVGSQLPFDRLVSAVDAWCEKTGRTDVFAQIGEPGARGYLPKNFEWVTFVAPGVLDDLMRQTYLIVAHAGMGSIISALQYRKPIVIMPRRVALGEHRNDHQYATAVRFASRHGVYVAEDEAALAATMERASTHSVLGGKEALSPFAEPNLLEGLRRYILTGTTGAERVLVSGISSSERDP